MHTRDFDSWSAQSSRAARSNLLCKEHALVSLFSGSRGKVSGVLSMVLRSLLSSPSTKEMQIMVWLHEIMQSVFATAFPQLFVKLLFFFCCFLQMFVLVIVVTGQPPHYHRYILSMTLSTGGSYKSRLSNWLLNCSLAQPDLFFFFIGTGRKGSGEHSIALLLAYPISHLKGFLTAASGMLISLNDVIMPACSLEKDDKVVRNARPTYTANTISHHCSLISWSIQFILIIAHQGLSTVYVIPEAAQFNPQNLGIGQRQ